MNKSQTLATVNKKAHILKSKFNITWRLAIKWAWKEVKGGYSAIVKLSFVKKSTGEFREAVATQLRLKESKNGSLSIQFWSVKDNGFRKAINENILSIEPYFSL